MKHIGFTGTRFDPTEEQLEILQDLVERLNPKYAHHGDCVGADSFFDVIVYLQKINIVIHPPTDDKDRAFCDHKHDVELLAPKTYLARNRDIVHSTEALIALPRTFEEEDHSGTWYTIRFARKRRKPIYIIFPDGSMKAENV